MYLDILKNDRLPKEIIESSYSLNTIDVKIFSLESEVKLKVEKINLFVGANNSGKSRFLRGLLKLDKETSNLQSLNSEEKVDAKYLKVKSSQIIPQLNGAKLSLPSYNQIHNIIERFLNKTLSTFDLIENHHNNRDFFEAIFKLNTDLINSTRSSFIGSPLYIRLEAFCQIVKELEDSIKFHIENKPGQCTYIPILRSLLTSTHYAKDSFEKTIANLYDFKNVKIYTGLNLYDDVFKVRNSLKDQRSGFEAFEKFLSGYFFQNKDVEVIADINSKQLLFYIDKEERNIHDIGDGIQQLLLLLFPIFIASKNSWFFIEEPETHLHPGLQRIFIETLLTDNYLRDKNIRYFFTTHSNHLLDLAIDSKDISIFQFHKEDSNNYLIKDTKIDKEILYALGVNTSSVFLSNTSVWVEGPTDRKYLSKFLKLFCEENGFQHLKEDIDYAFFEYGGNLIHHYLFDDTFEEEFAESDVRDKIRSFALSNKIYLLADNDNSKSSSAKGKRRLQLSKVADSHFKYENTVVVEIENLLSVKILKDFLITLIKGNPENIPDFNFTRNDYRSERLGSFYRKILKGKGFSEKQFYKFWDDSGTLKNDYKLRLCDYFINGKYTYSDLIQDNPELEKIIEGLYSFIKPINPKPPNPQT